MIRKIIETNGVKFWIEPDTGDLWIDLGIETKKIHSEDATELLVELWNQKLEYRQNGTEEDGFITKLLKSLWKG